jgi:catechol 2,3-dioxygenase-like lactoylglutathione lyase family enzyme
LLAAAVLRQTGPEQQEEKDMRLRQIALVGADLEKASADIRAVLGLDYAYADPGVAKFGLVNAVFPVGDTFLEVVSPREPGTTAGRLLEKRSGDGGYMVILQVDDIEAARARIKAHNARIIEQADFDGVAMSHIHPKDIGGAIVSVDQMIPKARWEWGGPDWEQHVRADVSVSIVGAELQGDDPEAMSARWSDVLGRPREETRDSWRLALDASEITFVNAADGRGEGLSAFTVAVRDPAAVRAAAKARGLIDANGTVLICGTRVHLKAA